MKELPKIVKVCENITKFSLYILVFLMPIFFLPWTSDVLDFNKQALLVALSLVALFAWMLRVLISGNFKVNINKTNIVVGVFLGIYLLSTIFSVFTYGSFWGWPQITSESLLSVISLVIVYFLVSNTFTQKEIFESFQLLGISVLILQVYSIVSMLGLHLLPFSFAKNNSFNTIGSLSSLGLFVTALLPLFIIASMVVKKWWRVLFIANIIAAFIVLLLINYNFIWIICLVASALILLFCIIRRDIFDGRWMFVPMFFLIISLFFVIFTPQIRWLPQKAIEVSLSTQANIDIDIKALKSSLLLGSGPGTFIYDFAKYRSQDFNQNSLWNVNFPTGSSKVLTAIATTGFLGLIALLALMAFPIFYGVKFLLFNKAKNVSPVTILSIVTLLIIILVQSFAYFLYNSNLSLDFIYFFSIAALLALISENLPSEIDHKTYTLKASSLLTLAVTFIFTAVFIFGLGFLMLESQRYLAEVHYAKAAKAFSNNKKDDAIKHVKTAISNATSLDFYFNQLALYSLAKLQDPVFSTTTGDQAAQKIQIQNLVADAITATDVATKLGKNNVENWSTRAYVCQNLIGVISDAIDCAIQSYDKAIDLNSTNPYLPFAQGNSYLSQAYSLPEAQAANKDAILNQAKEKFTYATTLKKDYAMAYLQLALVAKAQNKPQEEANYLIQAETNATGDSSVMFQIGLVHYQEKSWQKAAVSFEKALQIAPNYSNALYYLGLTYDNLGQKADAITVFTKVAQLNPDNENVQKILDNLRLGKAALAGLVPEPPVTPTPPTPSETTTQGSTPKK